MSRILVCEPHADTEALLRLVVERLGHEAVSYRAGGLDEIDEIDEVDAAVIEPGDADGLRLARRLREQGVPLLFTSIYPPATEAIALEPVAYLVKPFALYAIERALEIALTEPVAARKPAA